MRKTLYSEQNRKLLGALRQARLDAGLTQAELAVRISATQDEVSKCETGVRRLDVIEANLWVQALGLEFWQFIRDLDL